MACANCGKGCPELRVNEVSECCGSLQYTQLEVMMAEFFSCASANLLCWVTNIEDAEELMLVGVEEENVNNINDFMYLYTYLTMIYWQMNYDASINPPCYTDNGPKYYYDQYQLDCIVKYFRCKDIDIKSMLASFNLYPFGVYVDGIGRMLIDQSNIIDTCTTNDAIFTVR